MIHSFFVELTGGFQKSVAWSFVEDRNCSLLGFTAMDFNGDPELLKPLLQKNPCNVQYVLNTHILGWLSTLLSFGPPWVRTALMEIKAAVHFKKSACQIVYTPVTPFLHQIQQVL